MLGEDKLHQLPDCHQQHEHDGEEDGGLLERLNQPESNEADQLDAGEQVHSGQRHLAEVGVVRLVLLGHEEQQEPVEKL